MAALPTPGDWIFTLLPSPKRLTRARLIGFWAGRPFGPAEGRGRAIAHVWEASGPQEIKVAGIKEPNLARATFGADAVGSSDVRGQSHALLLRRATDGGLSTIDLHDPRFQSTRALGAAGGQQVGYGQRKGSPRDAALLWTGSAASCVELTAPAPEAKVTATATDGATQVGSYSTREIGGHALLWHGAGAAGADLHPEKGGMSQAEAVRDGEQVGTYWRGLVSRPALWRGTPASFVDLTPKEAHGGSLIACARGLQVGSIATDKEGRFLHAAIWAGSPETCFDLQSLVPTQDFNYSHAQAIAIDGNRLRIAGEVSLFKDGASYAERAALWEAELPAA